MDEPRLKTAVWVSATLRQAQRADAFGAVLRRGDPDAGAVLVVLRDRENRMTVLSQLRTGSGAMAWTRATGSDPVDQSGVDAYLERATRRDPDLWVIEFDTRDLSPPFPAPMA